MDERMHAALEGELPREELSAAEQAAAGAFDARVDGLRASLGARAPRDLDVAVMRRIRELGLEPLPAAAPARGARRLAHALWTAREFRFSLRPAYPLAAAALLAALLALPVLRPDAPPLPRTAAADDGRTAVFVQFRIDAAGARSVDLAGSFSDWQPAHRLQQTSPGVWTIVVPVTPGVHDYAFLIDGERWLADPAAPQVADGFGGVNSRLTLLTPTDRS